MLLSFNDVRQVSISGVTPGPTQIVAAPGAGFKTVVVAWLVSLDGAGELQWLSAATPISGAMEVLADSPIGLSSPTGAMHCAANEALNLSATAAANGYLRYVTVPV